MTDVNEPPVISLANVVSSLPENTSTVSSVKMANIVVTDDALGSNTLFLSGAGAASSGFVASGGTLDSLRRERSRAHYAYFAIEC